MPREGLATVWRGGTLRDLARDAVAIARDGLRARARRNAAGEDEGEGGYCKDEQTMTRCGRFHRALPPENTDGKNGV